MRSCKSIFYLSSLLLALFSSSQLLAFEVFIENADFEANRAELIMPGASAPGVPAWDSLGGRTDTLWAAGWIVNDTSRQVMAMISNGSAIQQDLAVPLRSGVLYTLTFDIGDHLSSPMLDYRVVLVVDGVELPLTLNSEASPTNGEFITVQAEYQADSDAEFLVNAGNMVLEFRNDAVSYSRVLVDNVGMVGLDLSDFDNDGVSEEGEQNILMSDPNDAFSLDPSGLLNDGDFDSDGDGASNALEINAGTDPLDASLFPSPFAQENTVSGHLAVDGALQLIPQDTAPFVCADTTSGSVYYDAALNFPIWCNSAEWVEFQGEAGPEGPQGPIGLSGSAGSQGPQGIPGPMGMSGTSAWLDGASTTTTSVSVGIGTDAPLVALHVDGNIIANAPIAATHVVTKAYADNETQNLQSQVDILISRIAQLEADHNALSVQVNPPPPPAESVNISWHTLNYNEQHKILDPAGITWDKFGSSISISGRTLVIGADNKDDIGHVFVYYDADNDGDFTDEVVQSLLPADLWLNSSFGNHVANTDDTIVVGTRMGNARRGSIYIYHDSDHDGDYSEETPQRLIASDAAYGDNYGESVDISGHTIVVGASGTDVHGDRSGSMYIYTDQNQDNDFSDAVEQKISPENGGALHHYGHIVTIGNDTIAVGAMGYNNSSGTVYVYHDSDNDGVYTNELVQQIINNDHTDSAQFGIALTLNDNILAIGAPYDIPNNGAHKGSAFVYKDSDLDGNYSEEAGVKFIATDVTGLGLFGHAIAVSTDTLIITASNDTSAIGTGSAYVYRDTNNDGSFSNDTPQRLETSALGFAFEVAYQNNRLFLSSFFDNANGDYSGSAYHFSLSNEFSSAEGSTFVGLVSATENDAATVTYSIADLHDGSSFTIDSSGSLSFIDAPDFEAPTDSDNDNRYQLRVRATANGEHSDVDLTVTVTDVID